jgi:hypothetical protein
VSYAARPAALALCSTLRRCGFPTDDNPEAAPDTPRARKSEFRIGTTSWQADLDLLVDDVSADYTIDAAAGLVIAEILPLL